MPGETPVQTWHLGEIRSPGSCRRDRLAGGLPHDSYLAGVARVEKTQRAREEGEHMDESEGEAAPTHRELLLAGAAGTYRHLWEHRSGGFLSV